MRVKNSLGLTDDPTISVINKLLSGPAPHVLFLPDNYASTVLDLFDTGIIDKQQVIRLLAQRINDGKVPLMEQKILIAALPQLEKLEKLDPDFFTTILAIPNNLGQAIADIVFKPLGIQNQYHTVLNHLDRTYKYHPEEDIKIFELVFPLVKKLETEKNSTQRQEGTKTRRAN